MKGAMAGGIRKFKYRNFVFVFMPDAYVPISFPHHFCDFAFDKAPGLKHPDVRTAGRKSVFHGQYIIPWLLKFVNERCHEPSFQIIIFQAHAALERQVITHDPGRTLHGKRAGYGWAR
jgi:hypothetical protein